MNRNRAVQRSISRAASMDSISICSLPLPAAALAMERK